MGRKFIRAPRAGPGAHPRARSLVTRKRATAFNTLGQFFLFPERVTYAADGTMLEVRWKDSGEMV